MRSIEDFNAAASAHIRRMVIALCVSVAGMFAFFGLAGLFRQAFLDFLSEQVGAAGAEAIFTVVPLLAVVIFLTGTWLGYRRGSRDPRLLCPHCGTMLVERRHLVVATRNCVHCGKRVLAEPV